MSERSRRADRRALRAVRAALRERADRPDRADVAYRIYAAVLVAAVVGAPLVHAVIGMSRPAVAGVTPAAVATGVLLVMLAAGVAGPVRGPVRVPLPVLATVVAGPLPRRLTLRGRHVRSCVVAVLVGLAVGALAVWADPRLRAPRAAVLVLAVSAATAALVAMLWLAAQARTAGPAGRVPRVMTVLGAGWAVLTCALLWWPGQGSISALAVWAGPWGWAASVFTHAGEPGPTPVVAAVVSVVVAAGAVATGGAVLSRLRRVDLAAQAMRWDAAAALAVTGDLSSAGHMLIRPARGGRGWPWILGRSLPATLIRRDLAGWLRTPAATLGAAIGCILSGAVLGASLREGAVTASAVAAVIAYLSASGLGGGLRAAMAGTDRGGLYGVSRWVRMLWHLVVPTLGAVVLAGTAAWVWAGAWAALWTGALVAVTVVWQAFARLRGTLPVEALTPIPSPVGDLSVLNVLLWLSDAVVAVIAIALATASLAGPSPVAGAFVLVAGAAVGVLAARVRLRRR